MYSFIKQYWRPVSEYSPNMGRVIIWLRPLVLNKENKPYWHQGCGELKEGKIFWKEWSFKEEDYIEITHSKVTHFQEISPIIYVCELCGFEDDKPLRAGVNNHWRRGYNEECYRPCSIDAICYGQTKPKI